jgi:SAM-dependent methyltransferase
MKSDPTYAIYEQMAFKDTAASGVLQPAPRDQGITVTQQRARPSKARKVRVVSAAELAAFPHDTSAILEKMIERYARSKRAQNVSFRKLVKWLKVGERATHYVHSYPAKLLPQIAHFFIAADILSKKGETILDPFGGTGTVALEAILSGRNAYFADVNPLAQLIARVKTRRMQEDVLVRGLQRIERRHQSSAVRASPSPDVVNLEYWYSSKAIGELSKIRDAILRERDASIREFFLLAFSTTCRKISFADPRLSVPVRLKDEQELAERSKLKPWATFIEQVSTNLKRMHSLRNLLTPAAEENSAQFVGNDARSLKVPARNNETMEKRLRANSVEMIVTSPPYAGAQKYIRASSLSLGWLNLAKVGGLKPLENASIGREHFSKASCVNCPTTGIPSADRLIKRIHKSNPTRSAIVATYLIEMDHAIAEMERVLKPGGHLVLVVGNNEVCGHAFKSSEYLAIFAERYGLIIKLRLIDEIRSRGLMTKRNKTASVITREWVLLFQKPAIRLSKKQKHTKREVC